MLRIACAFVTVLVQLVVVGAAAGATISISPTSGPVGTIVTFRGVATECDEEPHEDAEVFVRFGEFSASSTTNPRTLVELDEGGAFSGTWAMPDPVISFARDARNRSFPVAVRCVDELGAHAGTDVTPRPATFTYAVRPSACSSRCLELFLRGTEFADRLIGNALANVIDGRAGDDVLRGLGGNDVIRGGPGNDAINSHDSRPGDTVDGGPGIDTCIVNVGDTVRSCERVRVR